MAIMYPNNLECYTYTQSEKYFYDILKEKLSDDFYVFYSLRWFDIVDGVRVNSECDFLIYNPKYGYITIELKGGVDINISNGEWTIKDFSNANEYRVLRRSPFKQAEESMYYFKNYYEESYSSFYKGIYGFAVAFPFYNVDKDLGAECPQILIIDKEDLDNIEKRIIDIFNYWRGGNESLWFVPNIQNKFLALINRRVSLSAAAGVLIEVKNKQLEVLNRIQDNYLDFIYNFNKVYIRGGAGTGKTWIGIKKAIRESLLRKNVLFVVPTKELKEYINEVVKDYNVNVINLKGDNLLGIYDVIIVDEAQDISQDDSIKIETLLYNSIESKLIVFYDDNQAECQCLYRKYFDISLPEFVLVENIRNTASIYRWTVDKTGLGGSVQPNTLQGVMPEFITYKEIHPAIIKVEEILNTLVTKELVSNEKIILLSDVEYDKSIFKSYNKIGKFTLRLDTVVSKKEILYKEVKDFKGLESDIIIYVKHNNSTDEVINYIAYTRARFYLFVVEIK